MEGSEEYQGDSPGPPMEELPDEPVAVDKPGTTAEEQREPSMERRLAMEEPDRPERGPRAEVAPIVDDDVATEDLVAEDTDADPANADLDREPTEVGEQSIDAPRGAEEAALHIEEE